MKKFISLILIIAIAILSTSCNFFEIIEEKKPPVSLNDEDMVYIDMVYNCIEDWDYTINNSGSTWSVDKIAFYDFDGNGRICFYKLYPVTDIYGLGYFVNSEGMYPMDFGVYETNEQSIDWGWIARTRAEGTDWNHDASSEEKYETLKKAYLYFKENNIYNK